MYKAVPYDGGKEDEVEIYGLLPDICIVTLFACRWSCG